MNLRLVFFVCLFFALLLIISNLVFEFGDLNADKKEIIEFDRTHTRALCSGKTCRDFLISCSENEVVELKPISGFVTFSDDWVDLRKNKALC